MSSSTSDSHFEPFQDQKTTTEARIQIGRWMTPNTTVADAIKIFESHGFRCEGGKLSPSDNRSSIACFYSTPPPPPPDQRVVPPPMPLIWIVTLLSRDEITVTDFHVERFPKGIGE